MKITLQQAAEILSRTPDEILFIANVEKRLSVELEDDDDIVYKEDGTVFFKEGNEEQSWWLTLDDVLKFKKEMEEGLVGELEEILND